MSVKQTIQLTQTFQRKLQSMCVVCVRLLFTTKTGLYKHRFSNSHNTNFTRIRFVSGEHQLFYQYNLQIVCYSNTPIYMDIIKWMRVCVYVCVCNRLILILSTINTQHYLWFKPHKIITIRKIKYFTSIQAMLLYIYRFKYN